MFNKKIINKNIFISKLEMKATRDGYGDALVELGKKNKRVVVLTGDLTESTRVLKFAQSYPDRFVQCGVAEQNMASIAAGLALSGKIPVISTYAVFCPGRNWDQVRVSIAYNNANVKLAGAHSGLTVGPDGATHQALEDVASIRCLANMTVVVPADYWQTYKTTIESVKIKGPVYFRFAREKSAIFTNKNASFKIGKADILRKGYDVSLIGSGPILYECLLAANELSAMGIECEVINNHTIKPIDIKTIIKSVRKTGCVVTAEEHQLMGGCGSAICEVLAQNYPVPVEMVGMNNSFGESGTPDELLKKYHMKKIDIIRAVKKVIRRK